MNAEKSVTVVHLIWIPLGPDVFHAFINSLIQFKPGCHYELVLVFNGVKDQSVTDIYYQYLKEKDFNISYTSFYRESGQDLDLYFWVAAKLKSELVIFFNSFSVINSDNWLIKYINAFKNTNCGAVSASASFQSHYSSVFQNHDWKINFERGWKYNFNKFKLLLKAIFYWRMLFGAFPNPHIRTNSFMISRLLFLSLKHTSFKKKMDAYRFESGRYGLTNQLLTKQLSVLVVDRNGKTYEPENWQSSHTFWISNQENLLVSDNQTRVYENATIEQRKKMTLSAWGSYE